MKHFSERLYEDDKGVVGILDPEHNRLIKFMMAKFCDNNFILNLYDPNSKKQRVFSYSLKEKPNKVVGYSLVEDNEKKWMADSASFCLGKLQEKGCCHKNFRAND